MICRSMSGFETNSLYPRLLSIPFHKKALDTRLTVTDSY